MLSTVLRHGLAPLLIGFGCLAGMARAAELETTLPPEARAKLDTFEGVTLDKADKVFFGKDAVGRDFRRAAAEFDAFILQFPESKAVPYAILQKGRSLQLLEKRFEAVKVYQEVLDFFPNDVRYAAAALYRIGECHGQNGDIEKAMKAWLEMADDAAYAKEPFGANAINGLADNYLRQGKDQEGIDRYRQVAVSFRKSNPDAALQAIGRVVPFHVRSKPDAGKLYDFYVAVGGFDPGPKATGSDLATDAAFWNGVRGLIRKNDTFTGLQQNERDAYFRSWAAQMQGKFPDDDEFQIDLADFIRAHERDDAAWIGRLDKQFQARQKAGNQARVIRWIRAFGPRKDKVEEYYAKLDFAKMSNDEIRDLVYVLLESTGAPDLARNTFDKLRLGEMGDPAKLAIHAWMKGHPTTPGTRPLAVAACLACADATLGKMTLLRYYHGRASWPPARTNEDFTEGLALAGELQKVPECSKEACSIAGNLLQWSGKYDDAIKAYQMADSPPQTLFWTAECLVKLGKLEPAVAQLREIENFFKDRAPEAALLVANCYRDAGIGEKHVRALRGILKKYPKSGQSSEAHQRLEAMGLPIGGGVDAE